MQPVQQIDAFHSYDLVSALSAIAKAIYRFFTGTDFGTMWRDFLAVLPDYAVGLMFNLFVFSFFLSVVFVSVLIWISLRLMEISRKMHSGVSMKQEANIEKTSDEEQPIVNERWQNVLSHINTENPNDWKLAILEADIMLGDMMEKMGYTQDSIGEKLKAVEQSDFTTIEYAWEAHKIRNAIAHQGAEFMINKREVERVIGLYEAVFKEFSWI